jgi:hypothetical protein
MVNDLPAEKAAFKTAPHAAEYETGANNQWVQKPGSFMILVIAPPRCEVAAYFIKNRAIATWQEL